MINFQQTRNRNSIAAAIAAGFVILFCLFAHLGAIGLVGPDEPRYAWIARAMGETGDWVTPRLYGQPWFEKPILYYWTAAIGFLAHLPPEWAARFPSAIAAFAAALAIGWLGWKHYEAAEGIALSPAILAPVLFSTSVAAIAFARAATPDMLFSATLTLAMAFAASTLREAGVLRSANLATSTNTKTHNMASLALFGACLGFAVLAKGPAAVILAGGAVVLWALGTSHWRAAFRLAHPVAILTFCVVALPWYIFCAKRNPDFLHVFIFQHNFERYLTPVFQHRQPFWFFGPIVLMALVPWTPLLIAVAQEGLRLWREKSWTNSPGFFFACWAIFPIAFFSFSQSKLPGYILPAIPPLALIFAVSTIRMFHKNRVNAIWVFSGISLVWIALAIFTFFAVRRIPATYIDRNASLLLSGAAILISVLLAFAILAAGIRRNIGLAVGICALFVVTTVEIANIAVLPALDPFISARPHAALLQNDLRPDRIFVFHLPRAWNYGLAFYLHHEIPEWSPGDPEAALVLTTTKGLDVILKTGRFQGDLGEAEKGILLVPVMRRPR